MKQNHRPFTKTVIDFICIIKKVSTKANSNFQV